MEYIYDCDHKPMNMAERKRQAASYLEAHPEFQPIQTQKKNLAESAVGKHWVWLVHKIWQNPYSLEAGRRIIRAGEVVDHQFGEDGSFRTTVLYDANACYTVEARCHEVDTEHRAHLLTELGKHSRDLPALLSGDASKDLRWMFDPGTAVLPPVDQVSVDCDCMGYDCAHAAANLYAFGIYLDRHPLALFKFQGIQHHEILHGFTHKGCSDQTANLAAEFGFEVIELED